MSKSRRSRRNEPRLSPYRAIRAVSSAALDDSVLFFRKIGNDRAVVTSGRLYHPVTAQCTTSATRRSQKMPCYGAFRGEWYAVTGPGNSNFWLTVAMFRAVAPRIGLWPGRTRRCPVSVRRARLSRSCRETYSSALLSRFRCLTKKCLTSEIDLTDDGVLNVRCDPFAIEVAWRCNMSLSATSRHARPAQSLGLAAFSSNPSARRSVSAAALRSSSVMRSASSSSRRCAVAPRSASCFGPSTA